MTVKLALLKSGETLICDAKELISEEKPCAYIFENPHRVSTERRIILTDQEKIDINATSKIEISMTPWILLSSDDKVIVPLDWVVTLVEPIESVKKMYEEKVNGKSSNVSFTEE